MQIRQLWGEKELGLLGLVRFLRQYFETSDFKKGLKGRKLVSPDPLRQRVTFHVTHESNRSPLAPIDGDTKLAWAREMRHGHWMVAVLTLVLVPVSLYSRSRS